MSKLNKILNDKSNKMKKNRLDYCYYIMSNIWNICFFIS